MSVRRAALGMGAAIAALLVLATTAVANHNLIQHATTGPTDPNSANHIVNSLMSASGNAVTFDSGQQMVSTDTDGAQDTYVRRYGSTELVSGGQINGSGAFPASFLDLSADGSRVWFMTREQLVTSDTDSVSDIYEWHNGATTLISTGPTNANEGAAAIYQDASADGERVFF